MTITKQDPSHKKVSIIGLGLMGRALAAAFLKAGYSVTVWNRTKGKAEDIVARGAAYTESVGEAVASSQLVVVCVSDYDAVYEILNPVGDALSGPVLVNLTSASSGQARTFADWAAERNITYLDGAIMALPPAIGTDDAIIIYSGPATAFEKVEPALKKLSPAGTKYLGEDHGLSALYDVAILGMMWSLLNSFYQGAALLEKAGVKASEFALYAKPLAETIASWLPAEAQQIDDKSYLDPAAESSIHTNMAAMDHLIHENEDYGINADLPKLFRFMTDRAVADGHGNSSYAAIIEQFRKPSG